MIKISSRSPDIASHPRRHQKAIVVVSIETNQIFSAGHSPFVLLMICATPMTSPAIKSISVCVFASRGKKSKTVRCGNRSNICVDQKSDIFTLVITYWHRKNRVGLVAGFLVDFIVESRILVSILYVDNLLRLGDDSGDANAEWNDDVLGFGQADCVIESCDGGEENVCNWPESRYG